MAKKSNDWVSPPEGESVIAQDVAPVGKAEDSVELKPGRVHGAKAIEEWGKELKAPALDIELARRVRGWPVGRLVTRDQFTTAVEAAKTAPIR